MKKIFYFVLINFFVNNLFSAKMDIFNYKIYKTDNFDIYYIENTLSDQFLEINEILNDCYKNHTEYFDVSFNYKIPIFIFYGYQQFLQNTIVNISEETGGVTEAFKNRLLVPYTGSKKFLQHVINHEFIHEIEFNILYSGFWKTPLLLKSVFYPHWLLEGLAEYRASLFTKTKQEMLVRDMATLNNLIPLQHLHNFSHLKPHMILPAYEQSAKLMEYIEREYGREALVNMLKIYRDKFDVNSVLNPTLGTNLKILEQKFFEEIKTNYNYEVTTNNMEDPPKENRLSKKEFFPTHCFSPVVFKDKVIFVEDSEGKRLFYFLDSKGKKNLLIPKSLLIKNVDFLQLQDTRVSVSSTGKLCFVGMKDNRSYVFIYDIERKKFEKYSFKDIDLINSTFISEDAEQIYISGIKSSKSVLYEYNINKKDLRKIKEDDSFISQLALSKDKRFLVYSKEIPCSKKNIKTWQTDLFIYDLIENKEIQVTSTISDESFGWFLDDDTLIFISDYNERYIDKLYGVPNLFLLKLQRPESLYQLTNFIGGVLYTFFYEGEVYYCYYRGFEQHIYKDDIQQLISKAKNINLEKNFMFYKLNYKDSNFLKTFNSEPYKFNFSTDLFFPILYYSSYEGLVMLLYWQGSDMVGEHNIFLNTSVFGDKNYSYDFVYNFLKFRPNLILNLSGQKIYDYIYSKSEEFTKVNFGLSYPLNNISYINFLTGYIYRINEDELNLTKEIKKENLIYFNYIRNTLFGKYLEILDGTLHDLTYQISDKFIDGDYSYQVLTYNFLKYIHLSKEHSLFFNFKLYNSIGKDAIRFYIGGPDRISGVWYDDFKSSELYIFKFGYRFPIIYDINYYMWYLFPDFFFKGFYGETFLDYGIDKEKKEYKSLAVKFRLHTFILQSFILRFELIFAKQLGVETAWITYFNIFGGI